jgi:hypothetical protein
MYVLFYKAEQNYVIFRKMDGTGDHHIKQNKPDSGRQILQAFSRMRKVEGRLFGKRQGISRRGDCLWRSIGSKYVVHMYKKS